MITYRDSIDNLVDYTGGDAQSSEKRIMRRAVRQAFNMIYQQHPWRYMEAATNIGTFGKTFDDQQKYTFADRRLTVKFNISDATNTSPIVITLDEDMQLLDGETVNIEGCQGNTGANGTWVVSAVDTTTYILNGAAGNGIYVADSGDAYRNKYPEWVNNGSVRIGDEFYTIDERVDDFNCLIDPLMFPHQDSAGKWQIQIRYYDLPEDFNKMSWVTDGKRNYMSDWYVTPENWLATEQTGWYSGTFPFRWTILAHPRIPGQYRLHFAGAPVDDRNISFIYQRRKNDKFRWSGNEDPASSLGGTTIDVAQGDPNITGNNTDFRESMVGSVLRIGGRRGQTPVEPTGLDGLAPYEEEHVIKSVTNATQLVLESEPQLTDGTDYEYIISDLVDVAPELLSCFMRACEYMYNVITRRDPASLAMAKEEYERAIKLAMESDHKVTFYGSAMAGENGIQVFGNPLDTEFGNFVSVGPV